MELKYLNTFKTILETGSFQKAAKRLNYAQSTITLQIQQLEQDLSVKLFDKIGRKMELSQAGKDLLPYIDAVLTAVEQMENYGKSKQMLTGTLSVAIPETLLSYQMPPVLKAFRKLAPSIKLTLQTPNCYEIQEKIINGVVDLGVHYDIGGYGPSLVVKRLGEYDMVLVGSPELDMKEQDFITKGQEKGSCLLTMDRNSLYHKLFYDYLRLSDISLNGEMELGSTEAVKRSVMGNIGVSYLPRFTVAKELEQGILKELSTSIVNGQIGVVCSYHKNKWVTPAMDLFVRLLCDNSMQQKSFSNQKRF